MAIWGADVNELRALSKKLTAGAQEIEQQAQLLTKSLAATNWQGPDADNFRNEWNGQHVSSLKKVAAAVEAAGQRASQNAQQQAEASGS